MKNGLDFLSRNDASSIPKIKILKFFWIFCPEMTLTQIPGFGFFVQNSRIGVKEISDPSHFIFEINFGESRI